MRCTCSAVLLALVVLASTGCRAVLMPTPVVVANGLVDPFESVQSERRNSTVPVFVAAGRTLSGKTGASEFYTNERSRELHLGLATVQIGSGMTWDELTTQSRLRRRSRDPRLHLESYEGFGPLWATAWPQDLRFHRDWDAPGVDRAPAEAFSAAIDAMLDGSRQRQITIYVHGFNTRFTENVMITGSFWHFMARDGVVLCFDWPSRGDLFSYQADKANANFAIRQLRCLLEYLARHTSADRINIIAHSAGNPVVIEALRQLSLRYGDLDDEEIRDLLKIGRVAFCAPDIDLGQALSAFVDGAGRLTRGAVIYASQHDKALDFAAGIFGAVRLGRSIGKLPEPVRTAVIANDSQCVDVTEAQRHDPSFLGHSYFHANPWVSTDCMLFLAIGATAAERGLVRDMETGFMVFPPDYEERLPEIVDRLRAKYGDAPADRQ